MDWIALLFSSSGVSFRSGAVATKMAEESERRLRLLRHNNLKGKSGNKSEPPAPRSLASETANGPDRLPWKPAVAIC